MDQRTVLRALAPDRILSTRPEVLDERTLSVAEAIIADVRARGADAVREHARRLGDLNPNAAWIHDRSDLAAARDSLPASQRELLERTAGRIETFARAQRKTLSEMSMALSGAEAGHTIRPVERAGCYAPGGRFPLPTSVLMTAVTARTAGVVEVWVASPHPTQVTLAAAAVAHADGLLAVGGAQAIAALALGAEPIPPCDVVVGPGNRFVTAAKKLLAGEVAIDMLAGPSELVIMADASADPSLVAADLIAQAEHDVDARAVLVSLDQDIVPEVNLEIGRQLEDLSTAEVVRESLKANGASVQCASVDEAIEVIDRLAPEHLQLCCKDSDELAPRLHHYGALFHGPRTAEVFGDYGIGPNHVLPTGGAARATGGLSVFTFLRVRTWLKGSVNAEMIRDASELARLEGLEGHARAAEARRR